MKILVMSDLHGAISNAESAIEKENDAKAVIFLGDGLKSAEELSYIYNDRRFYMVAGNCDGLISFEPATRIIEISGKKLLITHGHPFGVKQSLRMLKERAKLEGVSLALYGHTHIADIRNEDGIFFVNPGTLSERGSFASYAVIEIDGDKIYPKIVKL